MDMKNWLQDGKEIEEWITAARRYLHTNAETGFALDKTVTFVRTELEKLGYSPKSCGEGGITATLGKEGKVFLLRADMDALPIVEKSGEKFAAKNGNMHACGHDIHTAMLLGAAAILKKREGELCGRVKLLFQPAEETLLGAKSVIENGALEAPTPQAAMMLHVMTSVDLPVGSAIVASGGISAPAADYFTIEVKGKGCHGSAPWNGVDALSVAAHILLALQEISAREIPLSQPAVLTVGSLQSGGAGNVISDSATLCGTLRAFDEELRAKIKSRIETLSTSIAKGFRASARVSYGGGCPTLINDGELSSFVLEKAKSLLGKSAMDSASLGGSARRDSGGSEDFAYISHKVPSVMVAIAAGEKEKGYCYPLHHPKVKFDEEVLPVGAALYAGVAAEWLFKNK